MAAQSIKILIADDHQMLLDGLFSLLNEIPDFDIVKMARDGHEVISFADHNEIDVVILDVNMPRLNGIETSKILQTKHPQIKKIVISSYIQYSYINRMLKTGVMSYLSKSSSIEIIEEAIRSVAKDERYFSKEIQEIIFSGGNMAEKSGMPSLTRRETQVLEFISKSFTSKEIASQLYVSEETVRSHRKNLFSKFDVKNMAGLIKKATDKGLI